MRKTALWVGLVVVGAAGCGDDGGPRDGSVDTGPGDAGCVALPAPVTPRIEMVGTPAWEPAGAQVFTAPIGTMMSGFMEFGETVTAVAGPNHALNMDTGLFPSAMPHAAPYADELAMNVMSQTYVSRADFKRGDLTMPNGIYTMFMIVPTASAQTGRSPDSESGPILPDAIMPIAVSGNYFRDGTMTSDTLGIDVVPLSDIEAGFDGWSHAFIYFADAQMDAVPGAYELRLMMTDAMGNGWRYTVPYSVSPPLPGEEIMCDFFGPQGTFEEAVPVTLADVQARICDMPDFYRIRDAGNFRITMRSDPCVGDLDLFVYDATRTMIGAATGAEARHELTAPGMSYIEVRAAGGRDMGPYVLTIAAAP